MAEITALPALPAAGPTDYIVVIRPGNPPVAYQLPISLLTVTSTGGVGTGTAGGGTGGTTTGGGTGGTTTGGGTGGTTTGGGTGGTTVTHHVLRRNGNAVLLRDGTYLTFR